MVTAHIISLYLNNKNMTKIHKNISTILIVSIVLVFLIIVSKNFKKSNSINSPDPEPRLILGQITREDRIKHIEWTYRNGKAYEQFALTTEDTKDYIVTFYQPNFRDKNVRSEEIRGGIVVFEIINNKPLIFQEIQSDVLLTGPVLETRDITNDDKIEILANWSDGTINNLFIYSWAENNFKLISPITESTSPFSGKKIKGYRFVVRRGDIQVKDLDGDNIDEVIILGGTTRDEMDNEISIESETIYKWNGEEYYLWEEEKINE